MQPPKPGAIEIQEAFLAAMRDAGIVPQFKRGETLIADGRLHRFHIEGHKSGNPNGAYKLHLDGIRPAGYFQDFTTGLKTKWKFGGDYTPPTAEERRRMAEEAERRRQELEKSQANVAASMKRLWNSAQPVTGRDHPYLQRKRVDSHGLRCLRLWRTRHKNANGQWQDLVIENVLLVPLFDMAGLLWNLQFIFPEHHPLLNRDKDFSRGGRCAGLFFPIGPDTPTKVICEGYATGTSIHAAAEAQVFCAFSAGNLLAVAQTVRAAHPDGKIILAADNDTKTPGNPGVTAATKAAEAIGGLLAVPPIPGDFNDLQNFEE